jgi:hypothetical protein
MENPGLLLQVGFVAIAGSTTPKAQDSVGDADLSYQVSEKKSFWSMVSLVGTRSYT